MVRNLGGNCDPGSRAHGGTTQVRHTSTALPPRRSSELSASTHRVFATSEAATTLTLPSTPYYSSPPLTTFANDLRKNTIRFVNTNTLELITHLCDTEGDIEALWKQTSNGVEYATAGNDAPPNAKIV
jgi:hypothetical protein